MLKAHKTKVCAVCGKAEDAHWAHHWKSKHPNEQKTELHPGQTPRTPFTDDWINQIKCEKTREVYLQATIELPPFTDHILNNEVNADFIPSTNPATIEENKGCQPSHTASLEDMTTGQLFQYAVKILTMIDVRLGAKGVNINATMDFLSKETYAEQEICIRPLYKSHNGCHFILGRNQVSAHDRSSGFVTIANNEVNPLQISQRPRIDEQITRSMSRLQDESEELSKLHSQMSLCIKSVRQLTLPVILSIADGQPVEIEIKKDSLKPRQKKLLSKRMKLTHQLSIKQGEGECASTKQEYESQIQQQSPQMQELSMALHEQLRMIEAQPVDNEASTDALDVPPIDIKVSEIESGDDLTDGILAVDGARFLLCKLKNDLKGVSFQAMKEPLVILVNHWRGFLKSQLQYFLNMLIGPHVGYGTNKVRLVFDDSWLEQRVFTINVSAKEGRNFNHHPSKLFRHIQQVTDQLIESASLVKSMLHTFKELKIAPSKEELLLPYLKQVADAVQVAIDEKDMKLDHRHQQLQSTIKDITGKLRSQDIISDLQEEVHSREFWATVDLKAYARWKVMKQEATNQ